LISNKFWMVRGEGKWGVGGGEARGPSWRGRIKGVEGCRAKKNYKYFDIGPLKPDT
jgi:hypothetical protein